MVAVLSAARPAGVTVERERPATTINLQSQRAQNSPSIVVDPTDPRFVALANRVDGPAFGCALHVSGDAGLSWWAAHPVRELPADVERCYAPDIAFDREGRLYFLFVGLKGRANTPVGVFLTTSNDRGQTFDPPRRVLGPDRYGARMALDPGGGTHGRIHLVWVEPTAPVALGGFGPEPNRITSAHSDDGGATFSEPVAVNDPQQERVVAPTMALGPDGAVHVAYYDLGSDVRDFQGLEGPAWDGAWSLLVSSSLDRGETFTEHTIVDDGVVPGERVMLIFTMPPPAFVADRSGRLFVAWDDARFGDRDVLLRRSSEGGGWEEPVRLNDDRLANGRDQYLPRLSVAPSGRLDAIFYDRREDPGDLLAHVVYTYSDDAGASFNPNVRVTSEASDTRTGATYAIPSARGQVDFGSRLATWSTDDRVLAAWTDTRMVFRGLTHQDIYTTSISLPATPGGGSPKIRVSVVILGAWLAWAVLRYGLRRRRGQHQVAVLGVSLLAASCTAGSASGGRPPLPPPVPTVAVEMSEYRFEIPMAPMAPGTVVFDVVNVGREAHEMVVVAIPPDLPLTLDEQVTSSTQLRAFPTIAHLPARAPGRTGIFALDLAPGRYGLLCFLEDDDGVQHARRGMSAEFTISGS